MIINEREYSFEKSLINYTEVNKKEICDVKIFTSTSNGLKYSSIYLIQCLFDNIKCGGDFILIQYYLTDLKIVDCTFQSCSSKDGIIFANEAKSLLINNTNALKCSCFENTVFLNKKGGVNEITYSYNSIIDSEKKSKTQQNVYSDTKTQKFEYSNMTNFEKNGYSYEAANDLTFHFMIVNINGPCFYLSGNPHQNQLLNIQFICSDCFNKHGCIRYSHKNNYITIIKNSFLFSASRVLASVDGQTGIEKGSLSLIDCTIQGDIAEVNLHNSQCSTTNYFDVCSTKYFTKSHSFSKSDYFSESFDFSDSIGFTSSVKFSETNDFTSSFMFSETNDFTSSFMFSETNDFTSSFMFSKTNDFTSSFMFSKTNDFTSSVRFSKTNDFTSSARFSKTNDFTSSFMFSETNGFTFIDPSNEIATNPIIENDNQNNDNCWCYRCCRNNCSCRYCYNHKEKK